jgi:hypothetical protein
MNDFTYQRNFFSLCKRGVLGGAPLRHKMLVNRLAMGIWFNKIAFQKIADRHHHTWNAIFPNGNAFKHSNNTQKNSRRMIRPST